MRMSCYVEDTVTAVLRHSNNITISSLSCLYYSQVKPLNHNRLSRRTAVIGLISCHASDSDEKSGTTCG